VDLVAKDAALLFTELDEAATWDGIIEAEASLGAWLILERLDRWRWARERLRAASTSACSSVSNASVTQDETGSAQPVGEGCEPPRDPRRLFSV
jgi:hypothetical protein